MFTCPVCFYGEMAGPPRDYNICPCCGTEFENDDEHKTHAELRQEWIASGARWFFRQPPPLWNAQAQLARANYWGSFHYSIFGKTVSAVGVPLSFEAESPTVNFIYTVPALGLGSAVVLGSKPSLLNTVNIISAVPVAGSVIPTVFSGDWPASSFVWVGTAAEEEPQHGVVSSQEFQLALAS